MPAPAILDSDSEGCDVLAEMLRSVRLTGSVFLSACFTEPFGVVSPKRYDAFAPMAHLRHISIFHLIAAGGCTVEIATGERKTVSAGDILLLPFADEHRFWNGAFQDLAFGPDLFRPGPLPGHVEHRLRRRRAGDPHGLRLHRIRRVPVRAGVPLAAEATDRSDRRRQSQRRHHLDGQGDPRARRCRRSGHRADARPPHGAAVHRGRSPLRRACFRQVPRAGSPRSTIRSSAARCNSCTPIPLAGGRWTSWRARRAHRAPCLPSASTRSWARRRSNMSPVGGCSWPPIGFATAATASPPSHAGVGYGSQAAFNRAFKRVTGNDARPLARVRAPIARKLIGRLGWRRKMAAPLALM